MRTTRLLIYLLHLTLPPIMLTPTRDEDPWQIDDFMDSQQPPEPEEASCEEITAPIRRSSRLASKTSNTLRICDWPVPRLLKALFQNNIRAPAGASHEELFAL